MKFTEPIGNALYAPLFLRLALGGYFILAGLAKLDNIQGFITQVQSFGLLPAHLGTVYGILVPYIEIIAGGLMLLGMWTTLGAFILALLLGSYIYAYGIYSQGGAIFNKDVVFFAVAVSVMFSGSGAFSIDRFRKTG